MVSPKMKNKSSSDRKTQLGRERERNPKKFHSIYVIIGVPMSFLLFGIIIEGNVRLIKKKNTHNTTQPVPLVIKKNPLGI